MHSFKWSISPQLIQLDDEENLATPNSTHLEININYPFTRTDTNLGIKMYILGANGEGLTQTHFDEENHHATSAFSYFSWASKLKTKLGYVKVLSQSSATRELSVFDNNLGYVVKALGQLFTSEELVAQEVIFSFPVTAQHEWITFTPNIGIGSDPVMKQKDILAFIVLASCGTLLLISISFFAIIRYTQNKKQHNNTSGDLDAYAPI
jgi:hypothetical protein